MHRIKRAYADSRYGQVHYRIVKPAAPTSAIPLLCLHQTPGNGGDWAPVMPTLGDARIVIAVDTPGYGMSSPPPEPARIEDFAGVMTQLIDDLAACGEIPTGRFDVIGYHTGSLIATELAKTLPDRVRRAVLFGLAAYPAEARAEKLARLRDIFPVPERNLNHVNKLWDIMQSLMDSRMSAEDMHVGMAECLRLGTRMPWAYISVYKYDFLAAMEAVAQPVLVMNPEDDLWEVTRATADRFPAGRRYDLPGVSHGVLSIEHDRVVNEITQFLDA